MKIQKHVVIEGTNLIRMVWRMIVTKSIKMIVRMKMKNSILMATIVFVHLVRRVQMQTMG